MALLCIRAYLDRIARIRQLGLPLSCTSSIHCHPSGLTLETDWSILGCTTRSQTHARLSSVASGPLHTQTSGTTPWGLGSKAGRNYEQTRSHRQCTTRERYVECFKRGHTKAHFSKYVSAVSHGKSFTGWRSICSVEMSITHSHTSNPLLFWQKRFYNQPTYIYLGLIFGLDKENHEMSFDDFLETIRWAKGIKE